VVAGSGWSRDGRYYYYYYTSSHSGRRDVWKVSRDGGPPEQVTTTGVTVTARTCFIPRLVTGKLARPIVTP
jgi:hypothetical protein